MYLHVYLRRYLCICLYLYLCFHLYLHLILSTFACTSKCVTFTHLHFCINLDFTFTFTFNFTFPYTFINLTFPYTFINLTFTFKLATSVSGSLILSVWDRLDKKDEKKKGSPMGFPKGPGAPQGPHGYPSSQGVPKGPGYPKGPHGYPSSQGVPKGPESPPIFFWGGDCGRGGRHFRPSTAQTPPNSCGPRICPLSILSDMSRFSEAND